MRLFKCLFDTGGTTTMANLKVLPMGARINRTKGAPMCNTIAGNYQPIGTLTCQDLRFPEFEEARIRRLHETRLLRVRAREVRDFVQERDIRLCEGSAIEVAHKGASDGERSDVG